MLLMRMCAHYDRLADSENESTGGQVGKAYVPKFQTLCWGEAWVLFWEERTHTSCDGTHSEWDPNILMQLNPWTLLGRKIAHATPPIAITDMCKFWAWKHEHSACQALVNEVSMKCRCCSCSKPTSKEVQTWYNLLLNLWKPQWMVASRGSDTAQSVRWPKVHWTPSVSHDCFTSFKVHFLFFPSLWGTLVASARRLGEVPQHFAWLPVSLGANDIYLSFLDNGCFYLFHNFITWYCIW